MVKRISDKSVLKATGKSWDEWFSILNKAGAKKLEHKDIAILLSESYHVPDWWSQMVTVQYEQEIKGRKLHETTSGYQISKSLTLPYSAVKIFNAVNTPLKRKFWLTDPGITVTKSNRNKSIRAKWVDGKSTIEIQIYTKENNKSQIVVQHNKLSSAGEAGKMKTYWAEQLNNLKKFLEKS